MATARAGCRQRRDDRGDRNYVSIRVGKQVYHARSTLSQAELALGAQPMLRISRSCLVNINYVKEVNRTLRGDFILVLAAEPP